MEPKRGSLVFVNGSNLKTDPLPGFPLGLFRCPPSEQAQGLARAPGEPSFCLCQNPCIHRGADDRDASLRGCAGAFECGEAGGAGREIGLPRPVSRPVLGKAARCALDRIERALNMAFFPDCDGFDRQHGGKRGLCLSRSLAQRNRNTLGLLPRIRIAAGVIQQIDGCWPGSTSFANQLARGFGDRWETRMNTCADEAQGILRHLSAIASDLKPPSR